MQDLLRRAAWGVGLCGLLLVGLMAYGRWTSGREIRALEPPGRMVELGGREIHVRCMGTGNPTVWIDAGNASYSLDWAATQPRLARMSRTCTYDRAGYGWSDPGPDPRNARQVVSELQRVVGSEPGSEDVRRADDRPTNEGAPGEPPSTLLVGHSLGGMHALLYAATRADQIVGLVLLDPAAPDLVQSSRFARTRRGSMGYYRTMKLLTRTGLLPVLGPLADEESLPETARRIPEVRSEYLTLSLDPVFWQTAIAELEQIESSAGQVERAIEGPGIPLGDLPLIVLSAEEDPEASAGSEGSASLRRERIASHRELATLSTRGRHRVVPEAGHMLHLDAPDAVVEAVGEILQELDSRR